MTGNTVTNCTIRCRTASTPPSKCQCSCDGENHGEQQPITDWGVTDIEESDPFTQLQITDSGVEANTKRETVADSDEFDLTDFEKRDTATVFHEDPSDGWEKHHRLKIEDVQKDGLVVKKQDGFHTIIPPTQIPVNQLREHD